MQRRQVLKLGVAAAAAPTLAFAGGAPPVQGFVADLRLAAARMARTPTGAWRHETDGDVTALWLERLCAAWRAEGGGTLAGITGDDALFVLERLAWDGRRRVLWREQLAPAPGEPAAARWLIGPPGVRVA